MEKEKECNERDLRDGEVTAQGKVERMMKILRESAEEVVGREFTQKLAPFLDGYFDEMKEKTEEINVLSKTVLAARPKPEKDRASKERNSATLRHWRKTKRRWKAARINKIQLRWKQQCNAMTWGPSTEDWRSWALRTLRSPSGEGWTTRWTSSEPTTQNLEARQMFYGMRFWTRQQTRHDSDHVKHAATVVARVLHQAVIISLWKKKGERSDLDNHRGICRISIFARLIAKNHRLPHV